MDNPKDIEERLAEIAQRAEKATKGPWMRNDYEYGGIDGIQVMQTTDANKAEGKFVHPQICDDVPRPQDADFIAHSRADIEYLLNLARLAVRAVPFVTRDGMNSDQSQWLHDFIDATYGK